MEEQTVSLDALDVRRKVTLEAFSEADANYENAKVAHAPSAKASAALGDLIRSKDKALAVQSVAAMQKVASNPSTAADVARELAESQAELNLLRKASNWDSLFPLADSQRVVMASNITRLEAHVLAEGARMAHHEAAVAQALQIASSLEGEIRVQREGGVGSRMLQLVNTLTQQLSVARNELEKFDRTTAERRAAFTKENSL